MERYFNLKENFSRIFERSSNPFSCTKQRGISLLTVNVLLSNYKNHVSRSIQFCQNSNFRKCN